MEFLYCSEVAVPKLLCMLNHGMSSVLTEVGSLQFERAIAIFSFLIVASGKSWLDIAC